MIGQALPHLARFEECGSVVDPDMLGASLPEFLDLKLAEFSDPDGNFLALMGVTGSWFRFFLA